MKFSEDIRPISYLQSHTAEVIRDAVENQKTFVITQNGEAKVTVQVIHVYDEFQESLALLRVLAQSQESINAGRVRDAKDVFDEMNKRIKGQRGQAIP